MTLIRPSAAANESGDYTGSVRRMVVDDDDLEFNVTLTQHRRECLAECPVLRYGPE